MGEEVRGGGLAEGSKPYTAKLVRICWTPDVNDTLGVRLVYKCRLLTNVSHNIAGKEPRIHET